MVKYFGLKNKEMEHGCVNWNDSKIELYSKTDIAKRKPKDIESIVKN